MRYPDRSGVSDKRLYGIVLSTVTNGRYTERLGVPEMLPYGILLVSDIFVWY